MQRIARHARATRLIALAVLVQSFVAVGPGASPAAAATGYQSDGIDFQDITADNVYNVDLELWVTSHGLPCADWGESCEYGQRRTSGYTWFAALNVDLGMTPSDHRYGLHGGLALGGSGQMRNWYADWSGYRVDGTVLRDAATNASYKPHTVTGLAEQQWYRLRVWRVDCTTPDAGSEATGQLYGWLLAVKQMPNGPEWQAGTWCLRNAKMVSHSYAFMEIIEPDPCFTDFWGVHFSNPVFNNGTRFSPSQATGTYEPAPSCSNTNLRSPSPRYVIDERGTPRGSNGGITASGQRLW